MSEKWGLKVSCSTDLSPTTMFLDTVHPRVYIRTSGAGGGVYPGYGTGGWAGEGYTGTLPRTLPRTHIEHNLALSPTYGQMKANLTVL